MSEGNTTKSKRPRDDEFDVSEIPSPKKEANVYGIVVDVSPVKKSNKNPNIQYFDGQVSDGKKTVRVVCFDTKKKSVMDQAKEDKKPLVFRNCQIKQANSGDYELIASTNTNIRLAPDKTFQVDMEEIIPVDNNLSSLSDLQDLAVNQRIIVKAKVISVDAPSTINTNDGRVVQKQECQCADNTESCRLVLWERYVDKVTAGKTYEFKQITVRIFENNKYLSTSAQCIITEIEDIGTVVEDIREDTQFIVTGEVIAVSRVEFSYSCIACVSGRVSQITNTLGKCHKCSCIMKLNKCSEVTSAKLVIEDKSTDHQVTALAGSVILKKMVPTLMDEESLVEEILSSPKGTFTINNNIITAVNY